MLLQEPRHISTFTFICRRSLCGWLRHLSAGWVALRMLDPTCVIHRRTMSEPRSSGRLSARPRARELRQMRAGLDEPAWQKKLCQAANSAFAGLTPLVLLFPRSVAQHVDEIGNQQYLAAG